MRKLTELRFFQKLKTPVACRETFALDALGIEGCAERLDELLQRLDVERQNRIRIRFSFEEALLRLRDRFGEEQTIELKVDRWLGRTSIQIEAEGEIYNPLSKTEAELEDWSGSLLTAVGLSPLYSYSRGKNILRLNLSHKGMNIGLQLLIAMAIGLGIGALLHVGLSAGAQERLIEAVLMPLYHFWIRMLTVLSGPVIFLMVCTSVLNTRTIEEEGGDSKRIVMRYFLFSLLAGLIAVFTSGVLSQESFLWGRTLGIDATNYWDALLQIMPENALAPLMESNTPQILLLAFALGSGIAMLGPRTDGLNRLVRQGNAVGLLMTEDVSRCVPFFAGILLCMELVSGRMQTFGGMWGVLLFSLLVSGGVILLVCFYVSRRKQVSFRTLLRKLWPSFATAVRSGNLDAGYGRMERSCVEQLGMEAHFAKVSLPYGTVLYMPVNVIGTLMFSVFAAIRSQVEISAGWLLIAMVLSVVLFVATPPVPGANLLAYIMIFAQLQIPSDALIDAMIFDILFGIFASAGNQTLLQLELILQADRIGLLDKTKLRNRNS